MMVVPENIARFLERATVAIAGTRDRDLVPHVHRVSAWRLSEDGTSLDCFFAPAFSRYLSSSLEDNGEISMTVSEVPSHETYQFKGKYVGSLPVETVDLELYHAYRARAVKRIRELFGFPEEALFAYVPPPTVKVRFEIRDIFDQTPGPDAGQRLDSGETR